jgi:oligopeptide transport system substrate-binding protein
MRGKTPVKVAVGLTAIALFGAACSSGDDNGGGSGTSDTNPNGTVSVEIAEPQFLLPTNTNETSGSQVLDALFTPLVTYDDKNKPVMAQAESITSTDNTTWTIKIKSGYTFHNGEPVTADSYIDAWNYGAYGPNAQNNNYFFATFQGYDELNPADPDGDGPKTAPKPPTNKLAGMKKVDDTTFTVTLSAPFSEFPTILGYTAFYPLPKAAFESDGVIKKGFEDSIIGDGPFKMKGTWQHDAQIEVEKFDAFPGTKPKIAGATFKIYQQLTTAYADLQADNLDVLTTIPTENIANAPTDLGDRFKQSPSSTFQFVAFPTYDKEFSNAEVRKAVSMAIDRDEIIKNVFKNSQVSAHSFVSPVVAGYREDTCGDACKFDPAKAKQLYTSNGGPASITITYNADGGHADWVNATCNQLKTNLGIQCVGQAEPKFADLLTKLDQKKLKGMFRLGWVMDYPSMQNYLGPLYSTDGSSNYYGYSNPQFDQLVKDGESAKTADEAISKYQAAEDILAKDMPVIPLRFGQNNYGYSTKVQNVDVDLFTRVDLTKIEVKA